MSGGWWAVVLAGGWLVLYVIECAWFPWGSCRGRRCKGGKVRSPFTDAWRDHGKCGGKGKRVRLGRRLWDSL